MFCLAGSWTSTFRLEQQGEAADATIQQLCGAVLKFATDLASSGPLPVPVQPLSAATEPAAHDAALSSGDEDCTLNWCRICCRAAQRVCDHHVHFGSFSACRPIGPMVHITIAAKDFLCMRASVHVR